MNQQLNLTLQELNDFVRKQPYFDFEVWELWGDKLKIVGSKDLTYQYELSIVFHDVFYFQMPRNWQTDTSGQVFLLPEVDEQRAINIPYGIEQGYSLIKIVAEDIAPIYISARKMEAFYDIKKRYAEPRLN